MKKIVSIAILLLVLIAFSGVASASYVTDKHSKTDYYGKVNNHAKYKDIMSTNVVHYSKTHIKFHYKGIYQEWYSGHWHTTMLTNYYRDYKKISYNKINEKGYWIQNSKYYFDNQFVTKTTRSVYSQYKKENLVNYMLR